MPFNGRNFHSWVFPFLTASATALVCSLFASGLEKVTAYHLAHPLLTLLLPLILWFTRYAEPALPSRLAARLRISQQSISGLFLIPLSLLSHLGGASVGRESVAVHAGRSIASIAASLQLSKKNSESDSVTPLQFNPDLLRAGIAAGFSALFGTPLAAFVFAFEWRPETENKAADSEVEKLTTRSAFATFGMCAVASAVSFLLSTRILGVVHNHFRTGMQVFNQPWLIFLCLLSLCALIVSVVHYFSGRLFVRWFSFFENRPVFRVLIPSLLLAVFFQISELQKYKGLGLEIIQSSFSEGSAQAVKVFDPLLKSLFTSFSLAAGFKGGEVTPLLSVGASLGAVLGATTGVSSQAAAAAGFPLIFAILFRVPLCGLVLTAEMFGLQQFLLNALPLLILFNFRNYLRQR